MKPQTRAERLYDYFMDREGQRVSTFTLERLAGRRSWRTRVSQVRKRVRGLRRNIVNELVYVRRGKRIVRVDSFYRLVKTGRSRKAAV